MRKKIAWLMALAVLSGSVIAPVANAASEDASDEVLAEVLDENEDEDMAEDEAEDAEEEIEVVSEPKADPKAELQEAIENSTVTAETVIADGVYIDEVNVGGMTGEQAMDAVLARVDELGSKVLTLTLEEADDVDPLEVSVSEIGLETEGLANTVVDALSLGKSGNLIARYKARKDLEVSNQVYEINFTVDSDMVERFVEEETSELSVEPVNAEITKSGGSFSVTQSKTGIEVNVEETVAAIETAMESWNKEDISVEATAQVKQPERTTEALEQIEDSIGTFSTSTSSASSAKLQNLNVGVKLTTGTVIMPGESWSMHSALSPFTAANGYTQQVAYSNGGYVQEYGGGICQLATTLYNASLRAEVNISKRSNHSMIVGYTDIGLDATINDAGSKDLELTNDFDFPIYIEGSVGGGYVTYTIWGKETRPSNRTLKFYGVTIERIESGTQETIDPSLAPGQVVVDQATAYPQATAQAYKEIYVDGVLQEKILLHTDKYRASPRKVRVGPTVAATTAPADTSAATDPSTDAATEAPTTEAPATEAPATEAPATEAPATEAPATEAPAAEVTE